jgi:hypothetical protein
VARLLLLQLLIASSTCVALGGMIDLVCSADVENVGRITVPEDHTFFLRLTCTTCRTEFPNAVGISRDMVVEGIRGTRPALPPHTPASALTIALSALPVLRQAAPQPPPPTRALTRALTARAGCRRVGKCADEVQRMRPAA